MFHNIPPIVIPVPENVLITVYPNLNELITIRKASIPAFPLNIPIGVVDKRTHFNVSILLKNLTFCF
jgi:hypothetical protein